jgi:hypothetical protein
MEKIIKVREWTISETQNFTTPACYPDSGMYLVTDGLSSHLVYVNRKSDFVLMIAPKENIPEEIFDVSELEAELIKSESFPPEGFVSESFVLDFSKMLLSQRK